MPEWTRRLQETIEQRTGKRVVDAEYVALSEASDSQRRSMEKELDLLGWYTLDHIAGQGHEVKAIERRKMASQARMVWLQDPIAGASIDLSCQFIFGRGVPRPKCADAKVQAIVDDAWCHDAATETLTEDGWLGLDELREAWSENRMPRVAAFSREKNCIVYETPSAMCVAPYDGEMVVLKDNSAEALCVTPNHRMLIVPRHEKQQALARQVLSLVSEGMQRPVDLQGALDRRSRSSLKTILDRLVAEDYLTCDRPRGRPIYRCVEGRQMVEAGFAWKHASDYSAHVDRTPAPIGCEGHHVETFILPGCEVRARSQRLVAAGRVSQHERARGKKAHGAIEINMDAWLKWLGWFIAEGHTGGGPDCGPPYVCQSLSSPHLSALQDACQAIGVDGRAIIRDERMWDWYPQPAKQFREWLQANVGARTADKRIPAFVFELVPEQQQQMLEGLMLGDGNATRWLSVGSGAYYTASPQLADDVQRLALNCGYLARVACTKRSARIHREGRALPAESSFRVQIAPARERTFQRAGADYRGDVYCFSMPSGTMVTRREGVPVVSGNTDPDNQLVLTTFQAQVALCTDLLIQSNVFILFFEGDDGKVKLGILDHDAVEDAVRDPDNRLRVLYYVARKSEYIWNFANDRMSIKPFIDGGAGAKPRVWYYRALASADSETGELLTDAGNLAPPEKTADGLVYHLAVNRGSDQVFGIPAMRRAVRWMCHDDQTEVLTEDGWLGLGDLEARASLPKVASYSPQNESLEMCQPQALHAYEYDGELLHFESRRGFDAMVTPNHRMVGYTAGGAWQTLRADEVVARRVYVPTQPSLVAGRREEFTLPSVECREHSETMNAWRERRTAVQRQWALALRAEGLTQSAIASKLDCTQSYVSLLLSGRPMRWRGAKRRHAPLGLQMDAWLDYLGLFVSEGYGQGYVCQTERGKLAAVDAIFEGLGVDYTVERRRTGMHIFKPQPAKQFGAWLREWVGTGARNKRLPPMVFDLAPGQQERLLRALMVGDGTWGRGYGTYYTGSKRLADDVQRLAVNAGYASRITPDDRPRTTPSGHRTSERQYCISMSRQSRAASIPRRALPTPRRVPYRGRVWCLTVPPHGTMVTRRNGRVLLSGNSALNDFMAARVDLTQAAAAFIMKRSIKGTPSAVAKIAAKAVSRRSDLASVSIDDPNVGTIKPGPRPGSILNENEAVTTSPFNVSTQAPQGAQDAAMLRSQIAAATGWSQHYLGDASNISLGTAQCHDDQTEALTSEGWMGLDELKRRDADGSLPKIAAFDTEREAIVYEQPKGGLHLYHYDGLMARFRKARTFDALVTPDHRMLFKQGRAKDGALVPSDPWTTAVAKELPSTGRLWARTAAPLFSQAERCEEFILPAYAVAGTRHGARRGDYAPTVVRNAQIRDLAATWPEPKVGECACGCGEATTIASRNFFDRGVKVGEYEQRCAGHGYHGGRDRRIAEIVGCSQQTVHKVLGDREVQRRFAGKRGVEMRPEIRIPMDAWLDWLGWFIAEGSGGGEVTQSVDSPWLPEIQAACRNLKVAAIEKIKTIAGREHWCWKPRNATQWQVWLEPNVGSGAANKRIPSFVFGLPREQQMQVLRGLMGGDGACHAGWETSGSSSYGTTSEGLADDVQRLAMHCGFRTSLRALPSYETKRGTRTPYYVNLVPCRTQGDGFDHATMPRPMWQQYAGDVWCFTLPSDTMITRRNGNTLVSCQSLELPILKRIDAFQELFEGLFHTFVDRVIQKAVDSGQLPTELTSEERAALKAKKPEDPTQPSDENGSEPAYLQAAYEGQGTDEKATERDLSYSLQMSDVLKRTMTDLVASCANVARTWDPNNTNIELSRTLLQIVLGDAFDMADADKVVNRILPEGYVDPMVAAAEQQGAGGPAGPPPPLIEPQGTNYFGPGGGDQPPPGQGPDGETNPYGAPGFSKEYRKNQGPTQGPMQQARATSDAEHERIINETLGSGRRPGHREDAGSGGADEWCRRRLAVRRSIAQRSSGAIVAPTQ